ncbi:MAG: elongation factor P [Lentisphaeria bacterium]|nr:elongation factor P [Lentisphaeria bacterium]
MFSASDLRKGLKVEIDGQPWVITDFDFMKPGKGQAIYRCKLKNMLTGNTTDKSYRSNDKIGKPDLMDKDYTYSYYDGANYIFSDDDTYEEIEVSAEILGNQVNFIVENMQCKILLFNDQPMEVSLPNFIEKEIARTEPAVKGDTATNVTKPAYIDNGYEIHVPLFINEGDLVRIDTRTGEYADRVKKA